MTARLPSFSAERSLPGFSADRTLVGPRNGYQLITHLTTLVEPGVRLAQGRPCSDPTSRACADCWLACLEGCDSPNPRNCFPSCRIDCGGQPRDPGPVTDPWAPTSTYSETICTASHQETECHYVPPVYDNQGNLIRDGYFSRSTRSVCDASYNRTCTDWFGPCTRTSPPSCVRSSFGLLTCCGAHYQYPYIKRCDDGFQNAGCGFCLW
jgi:hypothetical protein